MLLSACADVRPAACALVVTLRFSPPKRATEVVVTEPLPSHQPLRLLSPSSLSSIPSFPILSPRLPASASAQGLRGHAGAPPNPGCHASAPRWPERPIYDGCAGVAPSRFLRRCPRRAFVPGRSSSPRRPCRLSLVTSCGPCRWSCNWHWEVQNWSFGLQW